MTKRQKNNEHTAEPMHEIQTLTPKGSTTITGIGLNATYDLLRRGIMPSILVGKRRKIPRSALLRWLDSCGRQEA
jgi:excisionase family DNA binding protein